MAGRVDCMQRQRAADSGRGLLKKYIFPKKTALFSLTLVTTGTATRHMVPHDTWMQIGLHLKPRHLSKLMRTSKTINDIVDNEAYWTRVAAYAAWHECCLLDVDPLNMGFEKLQPLRHNIYYMLGLDHGYYWTMERFFERMQECIVFYAGSTSDEDASHKKWCLQLKPMSLAERTMARIRERGYETDTGELSTMKAVAKAEAARMMLYSNSGRSAQTSACVNKFMRIMDDDPTPAAHKRAIFKKLDAFLYELSEVDHRGGVDYRFADRLANDICKF